ncbi:hypothetical protein RMR16_024620 (plasmid) [Agrobacterium sp. rho-13.3]|uniref:hypothetical protein n=1 Tax=Agrobacterium sp. rho-13.3 TaxID=3072980 RepID=UPI002A10A41F|nr:hypothetical protein [Agrobacterium sp. rho-13.3]MDX8310137.1 hypothetical protein [Agrobacterium sp. rho-13.3]
MINFWLGPFSKQELSIAFGIDSALHFAENLKEIQRCNVKRKLEAIRTFRINSSQAWIDLSHSSENNDVLNFRGSCIDINLSKDAIEHALFKIEKFLEEGDFSPPEYYSFDTNISKKRINVFFVRNDNF